MEEPLVSPIGLADSALERYERIGKRVTLELRAWNGCLLVIRFDDVIELRDSFASEFSSATINLPASIAILEAGLRHNFENVPLSHSYRVFTFLNTNDEPALEIVAANCEIMTSDEDAKAPDHAERDTG